MNVTKQVVPIISMKPDGEKINFRMNPPTTQACGTAEVSIIS